MSSKVAQTIDAAHYEVCQDTHRRGLRNVQNGSQTVQNLYKWEEKWKIFIFKRQQRNGTLLKENCRDTSISIYPRHFPVHVSIDPTQYEAFQNTHCRGV